jgi:hypothetical protein
VCGEPVKKEIYYTKKTTHLFLETTLLGSASGQQTPRRVRRSGLKRNP